MLGINANIRNSLIEIRENQQEIQNLMNLIFTYFGMELIHVSIANLFLFSIEEKTNPLLFSICSSF